MRTIKASTTRTVLRRAAHSSVRAMILAAAVSGALTIGVSHQASAQAAPGEEKTYLIKGGTVVNAGSAPMPNTDILIRNNRIVSVGSGASAADATVIDATGQFVYPGMIDGNTGIGLQEIGGFQSMSLRREMGQFNPHMRALVALNVESEILGVTRMNGVTTVVTTPTGGAIAGQAALINTAGWTWEDLAVTKAAGMMISPPGLNFPGGGGVGAASEEFESFMTTAKAYHEGREAGTTKLDLIYEAMRPVFTKEMPAIITANGENAIKNAIAFGEKWDIRVILSGGSDAWKVRTLLAEKNVPLILGSIESAPGNNVPYDAIYAQPGLLYEAGVKFAFSTGGGGTNARHVAFHAALATAYGLPAEGALKALTIWPAEILGADKEIGSIAPGKLANLFITTGDPLDLRTQVVEVFIKGRQVPDDDRHNRLYLKYKARPMPVIVP